MASPRGVNPWINHTTQRNEQALVEDLVIESIRIHGIEMVYVPRELVAEDKLFGEDPISAFGESYRMEIYCETSGGFEGDGDFISKFGITIRDTARFVVSKKRFQEETSLVRPREGDLIYFPISKGLFEIKFVEHEKPFFQLGKNYTFTLNCELFEYSEETFDTGEPEIDTLISSLEYRKYMTVSLTGNYFGSIFAPGDYVYQGATANSPTFGTTATGYFGVVESLTGNTGLTQIVMLRNVQGEWQESSGSNLYYLTKTDNSKYYKILDIYDTVDTKPDVNNKILDDKADGGIVNFSETNPFGET